MDHLPSGDTVDLENISRAYEVGGTILENSRRLIIYGVPDVRVTEWLRNQKLVVFALTTLFLFLIAKAIAVLQHVFGVTADSGQIDT